MSPDKWHQLSFLIELKPRSELASVFIDCPTPSSLPSPTSSTVTSELSGCINDDAETAATPRSTNQLVNVREKSLEICIRDTNCDSVVYCAKLGDIILQPDTISALNWADNQRLFMCKVCAQIGNTPLVPKTFRRLASNLSSTMLLDEYLESENPAPAIECAQCCQSLIENSDCRLRLHSLPEDDWLDVSQSMEYFCADSCSHSSRHHYYYHDHYLDSSSRNAQKKWLPSDKCAFISDSFIFLSRTSVIPDAITYDEAQKIIRCKKCMNELGIVPRNHHDIFQLHHSVCNVLTTSTRRSYIEARFGNLERFFSWMLLHQSELQTSLKLVLRSYDKRPYLLIWLLESYVMMTLGELKKANDSTESSTDTEPVSSVTTIKMLYKVFDSETARNDPRANGQDASVGLVDVPLACCVRLSEILLASSLALPTAGRCVGQFYVGFLRLDGY